MVKFFLSSHTYLFTLLNALFLIAACGNESNRQSDIHFQPLESGVSNSFRGISAVNDKIVWVSGTNGTYLRTIDGGKTWLVQTVPGADSLDFRDVYAVDETTAYLMSAGPGEKSRIYKTENAGATWQLQFTNEFEEGFLDGMAFWNAETGIAYGDPVGGSLFILKTVDGGSSWQPIPAAQIPPIIEGEYGFAASGTGVTVLAENYAWICTGGSAARIYRTVDQGQTWTVASTPIASGQSAGIFSLAFKDPHIGVAVGGNYQNDRQTESTVAFTNDGGQTCQLINEPHTVGFRSCVRYSAQLKVWIAVGTSGADYSFDNGHTWSRFDTTGYHTLSFSDNGKIGWAAGASGRIAKLILD